MSNLDSVLDHITLQMTSSLELDNVLGAVSEGLAEELDAAAVSLWLLEGGQPRLVVSGGVANPILPPRLARIAADGEHFCTNNVPTDGSVGSAAWLLENGLRSLAALPLLFRDDNLGVIAIYLRRHLEQAEFERLFLFARAAAVAIQNARLFAEVATLNQRLEARNHYLQTEIETDRDCGGIVGRSPAIRRVLEQIDQVAATEATVLVDGETGTGKELVARTIHERSRRQDGPLVKVNCGAISAGLVESELFGHEKGAFTGAVERRIGRFELADGGTLFLDEVAELPLDTQVKLLRALQEQEFERVGSSQPMRVDVRIVAAGNRRLSDEVAAGRFRSDLFYRLNVFPIQVPPLRERMEDVALIAACALPVLARRVGKEIHSLSSDANDLLLTYSWPGNVRELLNALERASILCQGDTITAEHLSLPTGPLATAPSVAGSLAAGSPAAENDEGDGLVTLEEVDRRHIRRVLEKTGWVIEGPAGAAKILGLHANTLRSRLTRLGIERPSRY